MFGMPYEHLPDNMPGPDHWRWGKSPLEKLEALLRRWELRPRHDDDDDDDAGADDDSADDDDTDADDDDATDDDAPAAGTPRNRRTP